METSTTSPTTPQLAELRFTTRPVKFDDIPTGDYRRNGHHVAHITGLERCLRYPVLGSHLLAAVEEARLSGLDVSDDGAITIPLTDEERDERLTATQREWDWSRDRYLDALTDPSSLEEWKRSSVDRFAKAEGLDAIVWPA